MHEILGRGSISALKDIVQGRVLLFTQRALYELFGSALGLENAILYAEITENPKREEIEKAEEALSQESMDSIVAFGGGSVLDFAKAYRFYTGRTVPLIAIPTTAGTGSEATQFAVVYVDGVKTSLDDARVRPDGTIVDSQFSECAPLYVKACCAMDAYAQAIESFWAKGATAESRAYATDAISLCRDHLVRAVNTRDPDANEALAKAAHLAGKAINISRTTAAHALSYKLTFTYGIPHGHAVALMLPGVFLKNLGSFPDEDVLLRSMGIHRTQIRSHFQKRMRDIGLKDDFQQLGITDLTCIVNSVNADRLKNNPVQLSRDDLLDVMRIATSSYSP